VTATKLTCKELVELVTDYLESALSEAEARRFEHHLAGCGGCAAYLAQVRETIRLTGTLAEDDLDPEAREALLSAFRDWRRRGT
jgi:anti-sigma factor RsiW